MTKCAYCRHPFARLRRGRPARFCKPACRQRAYERRHWRARTGLRFQPTRAYVSNDVVRTPPALARQLVAALQPSGRLLDPCAGTGVFARALRPYGTVDWCEVSRGRDFFAWTTPVDWIVTNPPWSQFRRVLRHALQVADHVALVCTLNHLWTKARRQDVQRAGFGLHRILEFDAPRTWQVTGFQLGLVLLTRGYRGPCTIAALHSS